uniref:Fibronectin type-III domain-containing protein n=1 Tax=Trichuris muris TaxID=70415 RepID=A0A5S6QX48_TRIMR
MSELAPKVEAQGSIQPLLVKWTKLTDSAGPLPQPRHSHCAVMVKTLMLIFGGGDHVIMDELAVFHVTSRHWFMPRVHGDVPPGRASFAMVSEGSRAFLFGGVLASGHYSGSLYELECSNWQWKKATPICARNGKPPPCPRMGHSFTLGNGRIYLFGGVTNDGPHPLNSRLRFLNDLYVLELRLGSFGMRWSCPRIFGGSPSPRESHSACFYDPGGKPQLFIYGGTSNRPLGDVWILDIGCMSWFSPQISGVPSSPRTMHSANVIDNKMYIFGGWVPTEQHSSTHPEKTIKCVNTLACLHLERLRWEQLKKANSEVSKPRPRAGHCSVVVGSRIYIWSGRVGERNSQKNRMCSNDMWYLDTARPTVVMPLSLICSSVNSVEICWPPLVNAERYVVQIQKTESSEVEIESPAKQPYSGLEACKGQSRLGNGNKTPTNTKVGVLRLLCKSDGSLAPQIRTADGRTIVLSPGKVNNGTSAQKLVRFDGLSRRNHHDVFPSGSAVRNSQLWGTDLPPVLEIAGDTSTAKKNLGDTLREKVFNEPASKRPKGTVDAMPGNAGPALSPPDIAKPVPSLVKPTVKGEPFALGSKPSVDHRPMNPIWSFAAVVKKHWACVSSYYEPEFNKEIAALGLLDERAFQKLTSGMKKVMLESSTVYRFRVAASNGCGIGPWSEIACFKTHTVGFPSPPQAVKVNSQSDGVFVVWEPPANPYGTVNEYSVFVAAMTSSSVGIPLRLTFSRAYMGNQRNCLVSVSFLDQICKGRRTDTVFIFRVAAKNERGYGSSTQATFRHFRSSLRVLKYFSPILINTIDLQI